MNRGNSFISFGLQAIGGTITAVGNRKIHTFVGDGTFEVISNPQNKTINVLVIAGGGAGNEDGVQGAGGGGAGGFKFFKDRSAPIQAYAIQVGAGGVAEGGTDGNGVDSFFTNNAITTATGGGTGGGVLPSGQNDGTNGGSGGGGGSRATTQDGGLGVANQGFNGGAGGTGGSGNLTGGGGGASEVGADGVNLGLGGDGGDGYQEGATVYDWQINDGTTALFEINNLGAFFAGGGGGSDTADQTGPGLGGQGGGGDGGNNGDTANPGTANTGGGGGGRMNAGDSLGSNGGSGVVIVSYIISP